MLRDLKDSVFVKMNETFSFGDDDILRYQDRICVPHVDDFSYQDHCRGTWFQIFHISSFHKDVS